MFEQSDRGEMVQLILALKGRAGYSRCQWLTTTANRSNQNQKGFGAVYECTYVPHLGCSWLCTRSHWDDLWQALLCKVLFPCGCFPWENNTRIARIEKAALFRARPKYHTLIWTISYPRYAMWSHIYTCFCNIIYSMLDRKQRRDSWRRGKLCFAFNPHDFCHGIMM